MKRKRVKNKEIENRGGKRNRAGRPCLGDVLLDTGIYIRCSQAQKNALERYVKNLSEQLIAQKENGISLSTWIRELILTESKNEDLL
jgi:hypothetical protein